MFTKKQQKENREKWLVALRSGEYMQGPGRLRQDDKFCCLGVACEISGLGTWDKAGYYRIKPMTGHGGVMVEDQVLPTAVRDWLGFESSCANFEGGPNNGNSLLAFNDRGDSFVSIAATIEDEEEFLIAE